MIFSNKILFAKLEKVSLIDLVQEVGCIDFFLFFFLQSPTTDKNTRFQNNHKQAKISYFVYSKLTSLN
jgi:hypothetical protein